MVSTHVDDTLETLEKVYLINYNTKKTQTNKGPTQMGFTG